MVLEAQWSGELRQQQNTQKKGYRQWMDGVYEEMTSSGGCGLVPSGCGLLPGPLKPLATCFLQEGRSPSKPEPRGAVPTTVSFPDHHVTCLIGQFVNMRVWEWDHTSCCCVFISTCSSLLPPPPSSPLLPPPPSSSPRSVSRAPDGQDRSGGRAAGGEGSVEQQPAQAQPLEESFTIHLGGCWGVWLGGCWEV